MSRGRGLIVSILQNFFSSLKPRQVSGKLAGTDYLGNSYYEVKPPIHSSKSRPSRYYIPKDNDTTKFDEPLPAEWEAWLRLRRRDPPTTEEVEQNFQLMTSKKTKALQIDKQYKQIGGDDQVVTGVKNFPSYEEYETNPGKRPGR
uniref:Mimitin, mitochondrial n=1 Tax=Lygus hesperus TaxID=30085 RepID=A0A0A9ZHI9_LYGHE